ncbi:MAG: ammonium transporter [Actinobacteria bacterium]|nr:ammonium transporter [Actinomycetota bacterium]
MRLRSLRTTALAAGVLLLAVPGLAMAQDEGPTPTDIAVNSIWVVLGAVLVLFMQAGFAMLEIGLSRMKNAGAVAGKIVINLAIAILMFWATGFALAFGDGDGFWGQMGWFLNATDAAADTNSLGLNSFMNAIGAYNIPVEALFFFQVAFCAVSLAIVFGTMLDRTKFIGYIIFAVFFTGLIYPIVAHWTWGGGWLYQDGFLDFAGSSIVHLQGATAGLVGTLILGARIGKFRDGKPQPIPGHSIPLFILGVIILWIGWMGFNAGSTLGAIGLNFADIAVNTNLAAAAGVVGATIGTLVMFRTLDVSQMGNGAIAGLVAVTAPCAFVDPWAAAVIGLVAGLIAPPIVVLLDKMRIDDPVGAIPVHGVAGIWGTLSIGLFATEGRMGELGVSSGLLTGGSAEQLWVQFYGIVATIAFTGATSLIVFLMIKHTVGLRVSEQDELAGLDIAEHGMYGYPEQFIEVPGAFPEGARGMDLANLGVRTSSTD